MLETLVVAVAVYVAVLAVIDDVARVSPDESSTIAASTVDSSPAARFGRVLRE